MTVEFENPMVTETFDTFVSRMDSVATQRGFKDHKEWFSKISMENALGSPDSIFHDVLFGINRRIRGDVVPANNDLQGLTLFTRPNLNLTYDNISQVRVMTHLMTEEPLSFQRAVRVLLDTTQSVEGWGEGKKKISTSLVDEKLPYIAMLTNAIVSCSGWPDLSLNPYVSPEGMMKESWIMNNKVMECYEHFTLSCGFQNMRGDPVSLLFLMWETYMSAVYTGKMVPYPQMLVDNEIDYMTRIYRLILDKTGTYVQKWASIGAGFPVSNNSGAAFNFSRDQPFTTELDQIQVNFSCVGAIYNDPITLEELNLTTVALNDILRDSVYGRDKTYIPIPAEYIKLFNYRGYPIVDLKTNRLQWYVHRQWIEDYKRGVTDVQ